jgi:site-specific DNA recombinase
MKCVIYARYSSDKQREASIEDQIRNCTRYVERLSGYIVTDQFADNAISGSVSQRPEYQRMLKAAQEKAFDILLVDDLSRLARDDIEMKSTLRRLKSWGIRVIAISDGFDSDTKGSKIQASVRGLMNELFLDDLRDKTHRGMTGQALKGFNAGGRTYGYKNIPIEDPQRKDEFGRPIIVAVKKEIDPEQAKWVRQIFEWFADGHTPRQIAHKLNHAKVPSPRGGTWAASAIYGHAVTETGFLSNEIYIGRYVWNRRQWTKDPDTGRRRPTMRPETDRIVVEKPELRIILQELWERVKERQRSQYQKSEKLRAALHKNARTGASPKYLLSGLLKCGVCGGGYIIVDRFRYGCAKHKDRGSAACPNDMKVARELLESRLLAVVKHHLFTDEGIELFRKELARLIAEKKKQKHPNTELAKQRLSVVETEIVNIMAAIKAGILTPTTKEELERAEAQKKELRRQLELNTSSLDNVATLLPRAVDSYRQMVSDLEAVTQAEVNKLRTRIGALVDNNIVLRPDSETGHLNAELCGDSPD